MIETPQAKVFACRTSGTGEPLLYLHGFPTSSYDLRLALPLLVAQRPVVFHDHPGFGLSDKPERYGYSLFEQADAAIAAWRALGVTRGHIVAHDYGTSVATELLARRERGLLPIEVTGVTLTNGSALIALAKPALAQRLLRGPLGPIFARIAGRRVFLRNLRRLFPNATLMPDMNDDFDLLERAGGRARLPAISQYLGERWRFADRWTGALTRLDLPLGLVWGDADPISLAAIPRRLIEIVARTRVRWLAGIGHYPMLEAPERWAEAVLATI